MNERIRQLVKRAGGHFSTRNLASNPVQHRESIELWDDRIEKFAELLAKECIRISDETGTSSLISDRIAEHFGLRS